MEEQTNNEEISQKYVIIKIPKSLRNVIISRVLAILLFGIGLGFIYSYQIPKQREKADKLTLKEYVADFEVYKERLRTQIEPSLAPIVGLLVACIFFGPYELVVTIIGLILGKIIR